MKKKRQRVHSGRLPGIKKIYTVPADQLQPAILYQAMAKMPIAINAELQEIDFIGEPLLSWEANLVNEGYSEKATLTFDSYQQIDTGRPLCFAIETIEGRQLLLGQRESRYPVILYKESTGKMSEKACRSYTVTHIGWFSVIDVVF